MKYFHYCELIKESDKGSALLYKCMTEAPWLSKPKWLKLIDESLDQRLILMNLRDDV